MDEFGDLPEVIRDRLTVLGMEIDDALREARTMVFDVDGLPPWPCCGARGHHHPDCEHAHTT